MLDKRVDKRVHPGNVIWSPEFAFGEYAHSLMGGKHVIRKDLMITVGVRPGPKIVHVTEHEVGPGGWNRKVERQLDLNADDESRGNALFVVERARYQGGGTGHGHDVYPDGWHVEARRLDPATCEPTDERIKFYQTGCFNYMVESVNVVE